MIASLTRTLMKLCFNLIFNTINHIIFLLDPIGNGEVRLVDGLTQYEGRVEIWWNSEWRTISNVEWDDQDAVVVCRQLNYLATSVHVQGLL